MVAEYDGVCDSPRVGGTACRPASLHFDFATLCGSDVPALAHPHETDGRHPPRVPALGELPGTDQQVHRAVATVDAVKQRISILVILVSGVREDHALLERDGHREQLGVDLVRIEIHLRVEQRGAQPIKLADRFEPG